MGIHRSGTFIDVQDNLGFLSTEYQELKCRRDLSTEKDDRVQNVSINLVNSGLNEVKTDIEGKYSFLRPRYVNN